MANNDPLQPGFDNNNGKSSSRLPLWVYVLIILVILLIDFIFS